MRLCVCFCRIFLGGLSPAEMQQIWKELTNGLTNDKTTSKGNQDSLVHDMMSTKVRRRQAGDQETSSPQRAEWYDLSVSAVNTLWELRSFFYIYKHQRHVIWRHFFFLSRRWWGAVCFFLQWDFTFNSPWDDIFCFVCLLCAPPPEVAQQRKSLHDDMSLIKSK